VCDESSAIKAFDGQRRAIVTEFMRKMRYRLLCTATAAPNDYIELGTSSEALGYLGHMDMLGRFFTNKEKTATRRAATGDSPRRASGSSGDSRATPRTVLAVGRRRGPRDATAIRPRIQRRRVRASRARAPSAHRGGQRSARWRPVRHAGARHSRGTRGVAPHRQRAMRDGRRASRRTPTAGVAWCHLNAEGDRLTKLIDGAVEVKGSDDADERGGATGLLARRDSRPRDQAERSARGD
jgi:hypothetical protein